MRADAGGVEPRGHGSGLTAEARETKLVERDGADVNAQHHAGLGAFNGDAAAGRIAATEEPSKPMSVSVSIEPGAAVELGLNFEWLVGLDPHGNRVTRAGFEIECLGGGSLHGRSPHGLYRAACTR